MRGKKTHPLAHSGFGLVEEIQGNAPLLSPLYLSRIGNQQKSGGGRKRSSRVLCRRLSFRRGIHTTIIERRLDVHKRADGIKEFEKACVFNPVSNLSFGEGEQGLF